MVMQRLIALTILAACSFAGAQTQYVITDFPIAAVSPTTRGTTPDGKDTTYPAEVRIAWSGVARPGFEAPDSGNLYYSRVPLGQSLVNRTKITAMLTDYNAKVIGSTPQRMLRFRPLDQLEMGAGVFYCLVAWPVKNALTGAYVDTFFSNELQMIVESTNPTVLKTPSDTIEDLTPTFTWDNNPGVPYYHIILSDEAIAIDTGSGEFNIAGLSIVWQAITPNTQIVYGAPDPSGTITASPPPMSPGQTYSAIVLNNYGNHPAYTSARFGLPKLFTIKGIPLKAPRNLTPIGDSLTDSVITFKWTNLDKERANTYRAYIYVASNMEGVDAQLVVWEGEVTAGSFAGDTGSITVDARSVLTKNHYTWKVMAIDDRGAGTAGDTTSFDYTSATGKLRLITRERVFAGNDTIPRAVSAVEVQVEVLSGSMEKPLLFYTDNNGLLSRDRPAGTYRITAKKTGFNQLTRTYTVNEDQTTEDTLYLSRPDATVFGTIVNQSGSGIDLATVTGVSERGDTVRANTDKYGSFILTCYEADWDVWAQKTGYFATTPRALAVQFGQSVAFGVDTLERVPYTLSGVVSNQDGTALIAANVKLYRDEAVIGEVPSTPQTGAFAFSVEAGQYTIKATKTGFTSATQAVDVTSSRQLNLTLSAGAALATGYVIGRSWMNGDFRYAPITNAKIFYASDRSTGTIDTLTAQTDPTYGDYRLSLPGNDSFLVWSEATGFAPDANVVRRKTQAGVTFALSDTLDGMATLKGRVSLVDLSGNVTGYVDKATVSLMDPSSRRVVASAQTQADGRFEVRNIPNDTLAILAGREGLVTDTITPGDTVRIRQGRPYPDSIGIAMIAGDKTIRWVVNNGSSISGTVKLQTPMLKTLSLDSTLTGAGAGSYGVAVDADDAGYLDLSYHGFTVPSAATAWTDSVVLPVTHIQPSTVPFINDSITLSIVSTLQLDSARLYYRAATASRFEVASIDSASVSYAFRIKPLRDGADLVYYFEAYRGDDVYGYSAETYRTYVEPDPRLSKIEIVPSTGDTMIFAKNTRIIFRLRGYYGSGFIPRENIDSSQVVWSIENQTSYGVSRQRGLTLSIITRAQSSSSPPARVVASVSSSLMRSDADSSVSVDFRVLDAEVESLWVVRTDPANPNPITTAAGDKAEFAAYGIAAGLRDTGVVMLTPEWSVEPARAGSISTAGTFTPRTSFAGWAKIAAQVRDGQGTTLATGSYNVNGKYPDQSGLLVRHAVTRKTSPDTLTNNDGCTVVLPANVVDAGQTGLVDIANTDLSNLVARGLGSLRVIGPSYDINEMNGVVWRLSDDSIQLSLGVPAGYGKKAVQESGMYLIGSWDPDSLMWRPLNNTIAQASDSDTVLVANICHFSRYAVLSLSRKLSGILNVSPNPFSPFVYPQPGKRGTCISFEASSRYAQVRKVTVRIYNTLGDLVWAIADESVVQGSRVELWWNGKTTEREMKIAEWNEEMARHGGDAGRNLCRNGRYFVVLTIRDVRNHEQRYMKQLVLMK